MSQQLTAILAPALSQTQTNFAFFAKQDCKLITQSLGNLKIKQATPSADSFFMPSDKYIMQLKKALKLAASPITLSCVLPKIELAILPEQAMQAYTQMQDFSAAYIPEYSSILLNEHLFTQGQDLQQLVGLLRNELSHAAIHHTQMEVYKPNKGLYTFLKPWKDSDQKEQFMKVYKLFETRIMHHRELAKKPHKYLTYDELKQLTKYRRALDSFNPKQLGRDGYNVMQFFVEINETSKKVVMHKDFNSMPPPRGKIKQRRRYMETAFFREIDQVSLHGKVLTGPYLTTEDSVEDAYKLWADKISDFDQLCPALQRTFGPELCDYLRDFHQAPSHCDYSLSS